MRSVKEFEALKYFAEAPKELYVQVKPKPGWASSRESAEPGCSSHRQAKILEPIPNIAHPQRERYFGHKIGRALVETLSPGS